MVEFLLEQSEKVDSIISISSTPEKKSSSSYFGDVDESDSSWSIGSMPDRTEDLKLLFNGAKSMFLDDEQTKFIPGILCDQNYVRFFYSVSAYFIIQGMRCSTPKKSDGTTAEKKDSNGARNDETEPME